MVKDSVYAHKSIILTTKHFKSKAVAPSFKKYIFANIEECNFDTDSLGTFSGEVKRSGSILDCAKKKCELGLDISQGEFGLASEGSFSSHPMNPFMPCNYEVLYFIDRRLDFELHISTFTENTNFSSQVVNNYTELHEFAKKSKFPSHSLILRPNSREATNPVSKGIRTYQDLQAAYSKFLELSKNNKVWVETDMRANQNPTRMKTIANLSKELAQRLATLCPNCSCPGWGQVDVEKGLLCSSCTLPSEVIKSVIIGCCKCGHKSEKKPSHGLSKIEPKYCHYCNP